jgi:hypothetical protein
LHEVAEGLAVASQISLRINEVAQSAGEVAGSWAAPLRFEKRFEFVQLRRCERNSQKLHDDDDVAVGAGVVDATRFLLLKDGVELSNTERRYN